MFDGADETALFVLCVKLGAMGMLGRERGVDDSGECVGGAQQGGSAAEFSAHAPVKLAKVENKLRAVPLRSACRL